MIRSRPSKHQTEEEFAREVEARDAARALARKLLEEHKF
jgi:hypothetical protein